MGIFAFFVDYNGVIARLSFQWVSGFQIGNKCLYIHLAILIVWVLKNRKTIPRRM